MPYVKVWIKERLPKHCIACGSKERLEYNHIVHLHRTARKLQLTHSKTIGRYIYGLDIGSNIVPLCHECHVVADFIFPHENPKSLYYDRQRAKLLHNRRMKVVRATKEFKRIAKDKPLFIF